MNRVKIGDIRSWNSSGICFFIIGIREACACNPPLFYVPHEQDENVYYEVAVFEEGTGVCVYAEDHVLENSIHIKE
jgi:hypothetical protein